MVRGERVGGFVVTELLGSGRSGLLYRLEHGPSGQSAVLRTIVAGDDESSTRFSEEGRRFLPGAGAPRLVRAQLGDGTPVELLLTRRPRGSIPLRLRRGAGALAAGVVAVWVAAAVAHGPGAPAEVTPAAARPADDEGPCPPEAIWRQDVYFALGELDGLAEVNPRVRSIHRARSKALLRLVSDRDPSTCRRARAVLDALQRELEQRAGPSADVDGKHRAAPREPSHRLENTVSSGGP